jgi:hypothetical protein
MGLYIGVFRTVECTGPPTGQDLHLVNDPTPGIVAAAGVALRILVGQNRTLSLHHSGAGVILGSDEVKGVLLTPVLLPQQPSQLRVLEGQSDMESILTDHTGLRHDRALGDI